MKRTRALVLAVAAVGAVAALGATDALAICQVPVSFGQVDYNCPGGVFCYIESPGLNTVDSIEGSFWAYGGFGDPVVGPGDDNGSWPDDVWLRRYSAAYPLYMSGTWAQSQDIDGCIAGKVGSGKTDEVMAAIFSDENSAGDTAYFAIAAAVRVAGESPQFDFTFANGGGTPQDIVLVEIPAPTVVQTNRVSDTQTDLDVRCPSLDDLDAGFYTDGSALAGEVITGCNFYRQIVPRNDAAPSSRDRGAGWELAASDVAPGSNGVVTLNCSNDGDAYLALSVVTESGFQTGHVSANTTRVECGPNLAEPREPRFRLIERPRRSPGRRGR